jgi:AcrR family transcriptional regulator
MSSHRVEVGADVRSRIIRAAALLLRNEGARGVTTRAVARAAEVPAPTIFRLFGDKDGLMDAVAEHVMATYVAAKSDRASSELGDPVEDLRRAWRMHVDFGLTNPDLFVLLNAPGRSARSPATADGVGVLEGRVARLAAAGLLAVSQSRAVGLIHAAGTGAVFALLHQPAESRDTSLPDTMLESVLRTILSATPAPSISSLAALAVTFRTAIRDLPDLSQAERTLLSEWVDRAIGALDVSSGSLEQSQ